MNIERGELPPKLVYYYIDGGLTVTPSGETLSDRKTQ